MLASSLDRLFGIRQTLVQTLRTSPGNFKKGPGQFFGPIQHHVVTARHG
jgi:hypothetical protein